jgi:hypothetical protein
LQQRIGEYFVHSGGNDEEFMPRLETLPNQQAINRKWKLSINIPKPQIAKFAMKARVIHILSHYYP